MKTCLMCGSPSGRRKFCSACRLKKERASAIVSQNAKKLHFLLKGKWLSPQGFEKFLLYTDNIIRYGKIVVQFKTADELRNLIVINNYKDS